MRIFYKKLHQLTNDELLKKKYKSFEHFHICEKKKCDDVRDKFMTDPNTRKLNKKIMDTDNLTKRNDIYTKLMNTKIAKDYYNCLYNSCKEKYIEATKYTILHIEKKYLVYYKKPQKDLLEKLRNIVKKDLKDITENDMIIINQIRNDLARYHIRILFLQKK